ncbi:MAG: ABC transporter permease [Bauldia sp.]|nr:ABC transporter permease [Bauldia sp.]MCW5716866.1 ABC transporter permease [Bauldia sp.]
MTVTSYALRDSRTMLRRNIRRMQRYPALTVQVVIMPVVFLLLFVFVFGGTMGAGIGGTTGGRTEYLQYVVPGILLMTLVGTATGTAISVSMDMNEGIVARFRTMAISRAAVLNGHVVASVIQAVFCTAIVTGAAVLIGFRPSASPFEWLAAISLIGLISFAISWLAVALGIVAKSVESASNSPLLLMLLPFLGSGFVPTETLPAGVRWFAEYQPFTPFIEAVRGLLAGTPDGSSIVVAVAWCIAIALAGYFWARSAYDRKSVPA